MDLTMKKNSRFQVSTSSLIVVVILQRHLLSWHRRLTLHLQLFEPIDIEVLLLE